MTAVPDFNALETDSREFRLALDPETGAITYADACTARVLGLVAGGTLARSVVDGCEDKLAQLLRDARTSPQRGWEIPFVDADRKLVTVEIAARLADDRNALLLLGHVIPPAFAHAVDRVGRMMSETVDLNRNLARVNGELAESNRGIQQLLRELQVRAEHTLQESEIKGRLVANLSHELRTPLHSILGLTQLLASGADGSLAPEQDKQIGFIRSSAQDLLTLVNDVLDLGKLDAEQTHLRIEKAALVDFLASMRGVLRPLVADPAIELVVAEPEGDAAGLVLETDTTKLSQIVRNLVSNALKFTERGTVRVTTELRGERLILRVADTGIGIAEGDREKIFEEYAQIDSHLQERLRGTGLGLPLARRFAQRLGGTLTVDSEVGRGSTFVLDIPVAHDEAAEMAALVERSRAAPAPGAASILVVEDDRKTLFLYEKYLVMAGFHVLPARSIEEATRVIAEQRPAAIVLDIMLEAEASWSFLARIKQDPRTADIPVLVVTVTNREDKARALGADEFWLKPVDQDRLLRKLREIAKTRPMARVLVIDDDPTARYIIRHHLQDTPYEVYEASTAEDGVRIASETHPNVILLDFLLEGSTAFDVIDNLKADPRMRDIPVIVVTSQVLDEIDQQRLLQEAEAVISKQHLSRELAISRIRDALRKTGLVTG